MHVERHERGIHALRPGADVAGGANVCFRCGPRPASAWSWISAPPIGEADIRNPCWHRPGHNTSNTSPDGPGPARARLPVRAMIGAV